MTGMSAAVTNRRRTGQQAAMDPEFLAGELDLMREMNLRYEIELLAAKEQKDKLLKENNALKKENSRLFDATKENVGLDSRLKALYELIDVREKDHRREIEQLSLLTRKRTAAQKNLAQSVDDADRRHQILPSCKNSDATANTTLHQQQSNSRLKNNTNDNSRTPGSAPSAAGSSKRRKAAATETRRRASSVSPVTTPQAKNLALRERLSELQSENLELRRLLSESKNPSDNASRQSGEQSNVQYPPLPPAGERRNRKDPPTRNVSDQIQKSWGEPPGNFSPDAERTRNHRVEHESLPPPPFHTFHGRTAKSAEVHSSRQNDHQSQPCQNCLNLKRTHERQLQFYESRTLTSRQSARKFESMAKTLYDEISSVRVDINGLERRHKRQLSLYGERLSMYRNRCERLERGQAAQLKGIQTDVRQIRQDVGRVQKDILMTGLDVIVQEHEGNEAVDGGELNELFAESTSAQQKLKDIQRTLKESYYYIC